MYGRYEIARDSSVLKPWLLHLCACLPVCLSVSRTVINPPIRPHSACRRTQKHVRTLIRRRYHPLPPPATHTHIPTISPWSLTAMGVCMAGALHEQDPMYNGTLVHLGITAIMGLLATRAFVPFGLLAGIGAGMTGRYAYMDMLINKDDTEERT